MMEGSTMRMGHAAEEVTVVLAVEVVMALGVRMLVTIQMAEDTALMVEEMVEETKMQVMQMRGVGIAAPPAAATAMVMPWETMQAAPVLLVAAVRQLVKIVQEEAAVMLVVGMNLWSSVVLDMAVDMAVDMAIVLVTFATCTTLSSLWEPVLCGMGCMGAWLQRCTMLRL